MNLTPKEHAAVLKCGAAKEQQEHPWASPALALRIATDHGVKEYPQCIVRVKEKRM